MTRQWADMRFSLMHAVPRGAALAWYVFTSPISYWTYIALISALDASHISSMYVLRNIHAVDRIEVSTRVGSMMLCFTIPLLVACAYELLWAGLGACTMITAASISCLVMGGLCYVHRMPERWFPGRLDLVGNSHQLMHVFVVLGYLFEGLFICHMALVKVARDQAGLGAGHAHSSPPAVSHILSHLIQHHNLGLTI